MNKEIMEIPLKSTMTNIVFTDNYQLIIGSILILIAAASFISAFVYGRSAKKQLFTISTICTITTLSVMAGLQGSESLDSTDIFGMRMGYIVLMVVSTICFSFCANRRGEWSKLIEAFFCGSIAFSALGLLCPFNMMFFAMVRIFFILQISCIVIMAYIHWKNKKSIDIITTIAYYFLSFVQTILWIMFTVNSSHINFALTATYISVAIYSVVSIASLLKDKSFDEAEIKSSGSDKILQNENKNYALTQDRLYTNNENNIIINNISNNIPQKPRETPPQRGRKVSLRFSNAITENELMNTLLSLMLDKCDNMGHHIFHVAEYTRIISLKAYLSEEKADFIAKASLLHDIGKIFIPKKILSKRDQLTQEEYKQINCHTIYGHNILADNDNEFMTVAANIAKQHHEHFDGTGYFGLRGDRIDRYARIVAVADVFDALTTNRSYKKAWSLDEAFSYINNHSGDFFDPEIVTTFNACRSEIIQIHEIFAETEEF